MWRKARKIPQRRAGHCKSDLLVINKIDLAPYVGARLDVMESDTSRMRPQKPWTFANLKTGQGVDTIIDFIVTHGMLTPKA